jgi:hypothetical protein
MVHLCTGRTVPVLGAIADTILPGQLWQVIRCWLWAQPSDSRRVTSCILPQSRHRQSDTLQQPKVYQPLFHNFQSQSKRPCWCSGGGT